MGVAAPAIGWFRNDLRVHDNEALLLACGGEQGGNHKPGRQGQGQGQGQAQGQVGVAWAWGRGVAARGGGGRRRVCPLWCPCSVLSPRQFSTTYHFGLPEKTGGDGGGGLCPYCAPFVTQVCPSRAPCVPLVCL